MKIGLFTHRTNPDIGGGHIFRDDLEKAAMQFRGRHEFVLVDAPPPTLPYRIKRKLRTHLGSAPYARPYVSEPLRKEIARLQLDLLWFNHAEPTYMGLPYVLNILDLEHRRQPWFPEVSANGEWEHRENYLEKAIRRAAIVIVPSQETKERLCHYYGVPLENVRVLPFPTPQKAIDVALAGPQLTEKNQIRLKYGIKHDFLFYPAQFWPHKNHVNLLNALKLLRDQMGHNISLVLTGSDQGNLSHVKNTAKTLGLLDATHFCGFVPYDDILCLHRDAIALSYVSLFGPENLPPLEAMALGCPVILSDIPGTHELYGDVPFLVNPTSPQAIADGIESLLKDPGGAQQRSKTGKQIAIQNSCEAYFEKFQNILDEFSAVRRCWP